MKCSWLSSVWVSSINFLGKNSEYPSVLLYSSFDGRMIEIKSEELFGQSIIQNTKLYQVSSVSYNFNPGNDGYNIWNQDKS